MAGAEQFPLSLERKLEHGEFDLLCFERRCEPARIRMHRSAPLQIVQQSVGAKLRLPGRLKRPVRPAVDKVWPGDGRFPG